MKNFKAQTFLRAWALNQMDPGLYLDSASCFLICKRKLLYHLLLWTMAKPKQIMYISKQIMYIYIVCWVQCLALLSLLSLLSISSSIITPFHWECHSLGEISRWLFRVQVLFFRPSHYPVNGVYSVTMTILLPGLCPSLIWTVLGAGIMSHLSLYL